LLPRLADFHARHPRVDLRLFTNNNRVDLAGEGLDLAIRFGDGAWHGTHAQPLVEAPLSPLCTPAIADRLTSPEALHREMLLRSYRADEWPRWFAAAQSPCPPLRGPVFDSSTAMVAATLTGAGVALAPPAMFTRDLASGTLVQPFGLCVSTGRYWLTRLHSRRETPAIRHFADWITELSAT
jgi:LysR family transcriptional regulator of beta-lactamase